MSSMRDDGMLSMPPAYTSRPCGLTMYMCGVVRAPYAVPTAPSSSISTALKTDLRSVIQEVSFAGAR